MLFSSTVFLYYFLPAVLLVYYLLKKSRLLKNVLLFFASLIFYAWGEPKFVLIMMASIVINWAMGLLVDRNRSHAHAARIFLALDAVFNLSILFVFKYLTFTGNLLYSAFGLDLHIPNIALPIGISFFTFQAISYVIDVYRQKGKAQVNILYVGLYISFFPQLIAGPIVRYETVADEIRNRKETLRDFGDGWSRFVVGLAKKVLLANHFAILSDTAFQICVTGTPSVAFSWLGAIAYTLQIFFDFSGYSDMAIGLGKMFGFHFLENFNYPYIATSISDFWRRWHISLGTWFRDYLYFPLGGSRVKKPRLVLNLLVVWLLTGLWHGANYTFILWGGVYFLLIVFEKLTGFDKKQGAKLNALKWLYTMLFVVMGWVLFRADSIQDAGAYLSSMFGLRQNPLSDGLFIGYFQQNLIPLMIGIFACTPIFKIWREKTKNSKLIDACSVVALTCLFILSVARLVSSGYNPFIYFNF